MTTYLQRLFQRVVSDERGAVAAEYALMASLIAVGIIAAVNLFSDSVIGLFNLTAGMYDVKAP